MDTPFRDLHSHFRVPPHLTPRKSPMPPHIPSHITSAGRQEKNSHSFSDYSHRAVDHRGLWTQTQACFNIGALGTHL